MEQPQRAAPQPEGGPYAWWVVAVLILAYTFSFIDRQALTLMVGPIRESLDITDTQLSLLHGFAFALFYTVMGIPIGRIVDRQRRTWIIAAGIVFWSLATAACGLARNFVQMFLARVGVGVGEAALSPGAYSLISDYFPPEQRAKAMSLYLGAAYVGAGLATIIGGTLIALMPATDWPVIGRLEPWQGVFVAVGLPGILVAMLVLTLREPQRTGTLTGDHPDFRQVLAYLGRHRRTYATLMLGFAIAGTVWNGSVAWLPEFFKRTHGWDVATVGLRYGLITIVSGTLGAITGGTIASRNRARGMSDANIRIGLTSLAVLAPGGLVAVLTGSPVLAMAGTTVFLFGCAMPFGAAAAAIQEITPNQMRGQVSAIYLFGLSFFGMGFGPTIIAFFTDSVFGNDADLGKSIAALIVIATPIAAMLLTLARKPYRETLARLEF